MDDVVIVSGARTPIGTFGGAFKDVSASDLGAVAVREALQRAGLTAQDVDEVILGCVNQFAEDAYITRTTMLKAGLPAEKTGFSVNRQCGSGVQAIVSAAQAIRTGDAKIVVAGGTEQMSGYPHISRGTRWGSRLQHTMLEDSLLVALSCPLSKCHMGVTGENVAEQYGVSRDEQDTFAERSQRLARRAIEEGRFAEQIVAVPVPQRKGDPLLVTTDEHPKPNTTLEALAALRPAFKKDGTVTAGNASGINDGAAAVVVMSAQTARERGLKPLLRLRSAGVAGVAPEVMGIGPVPAVRRALDRAGMTVGDIDLMELNEAFAAQAVACVHELGIDPERVNPNGGAIALGHPVGATGALLTVKALYELARADQETAVVTLCIGGGQGIAAVFERLN